MNQPLDLSVTLTPPPVGSLPEEIAHVALRCEILGLSHVGDLLVEPLSFQEREDLRWYLEEYWKWPFEGFLERGKRVEQLLPTIGKRLYQAVFGSRVARQIIQQWQQHPAQERQISIVSDLPRVLSLPWELLHTRSGFLALRSREPVSLVRHLPAVTSQPQTLSFDPPLRILLVTARPKGTGFVDPRGIARELVDELQEQVEAGAITLEFLRPATWEALRARLQDRKRPIHVLHFDGHGMFDSQAGGQGHLAFEDERGYLDLVEAGTLAALLQERGVPLVVLTACQSAMGADDDAFSSVAAQLIHQGVGAVVAMSASVLVASATRYTEAFYRALTRGASVPVAHNKARQRLQRDPQRHPLQRHLEEEGQPVELRDWWLPHFYQQRPLTFQLPHPEKTRKRVSASAPPLQRLNAEMPPSPRYGFTGRARELQEIERWLFQGKVVVLAGFGGMGKTALAREAADWLTRTGLYSRACFISFEQGGDASTLLSTLGQFLAVYDSHFHPQDHAAALARLAPVLKQSPTLVIADNVESLLPGGEAPLLLEERLALWETLRELTIQKAGVLLTCRDPGVGDGLLAEGKDVAHLSLGGMKSEDAYLLASRLLDKLKIDHASVPYADLCDLLGKLDYHPLAIQLVVSTLRKLSLTQIREDFATLLPQFIDEQDTGRNRSLLASLEYSLKRLEAEQQALLPRLALFEGGANENNLLTITDIPRPQWASLCRSLEQAGLLTAEHIHNAIDIPFLRFHPVLGIFLRSQPGADNLYLRYRYAISYYMLSNYLYEEDIRHPQEMRAICLRELSNLRRALDLLLELREWEAAVGLFDKIVKFLNIFGRLRERDTLRQHMTEMLKTTNAQPSETLSRVEYIHQSGLGEDDLNRGNIQAAIARFSALLEQIESLPETVQEGQGSFVHCRILTMLAVCLKDTHQFATSELRLRQALEIIDTLLKQTPEYQIFIFHQNTLLGELAETLREQGRYSEARKIYEESLQISRKQGYLRQQAINMQGFGTLALREKALDEAQVYYTEACALFHAVGELREEASCWHQLGMVAEWQGNWGKAEVCYRESLMLREHFDNADELAATYNQLAIVARRAGRPSEAEGWYKSALELDERLHPGSYRHATHLSNLAGLLMLEMRAGHTSLERLAEAHGYAEQALAIMELHDTSEIWEVLYILAGIAEMEGQTELAHAYRHREREAYAAFAGNRSNIDRQHEQLIASVVEAARGSIRMREAVEIVLPQLEAAHRDISNAIQRLWTGEREWHSLAEGTSAKTALLILRILETLAQPTKQAEIEGSSLESLAVLASLAARGHLQTRAALEQAFPQLEANGKHIVAAIRRIWTGERDLPTLTNGFNIQETLVVGRILDLLAKPSRLAEDKENNADEADFLRPTSAPEAPME